MQAYDLAIFSYKLYRRLPYDNEMRNVIESIYNALEYASDKKIDKDGERRVKQMLYRVETLFREIEDFVKECQPYDVITSLMIEIKYGEEGRYSRFIEKSLRSSIVSEMELIIKELKPYSDKKSLITKESMVGTEFHYRKKQLIELLLDSNSGPRVIIQSNPGTGKSTLMWRALYDSRVQRCFYRIFTGRFQPYESNLDWNRERKSLTVVDDSSDVNEIKSLLSVDEETLLNLDFFKYNGKGSKIVILSSLQLEIEHIGASKVRLPSLDDDESWILFQNIAFRDQESLPPTLVDIGRKICHKCENIPGVINIVASILSSKSTAEEWEHFLNIVLTSVQDPVTTISSTIEFTKLLHVKKNYWGHWFAWCSLLPKDYEFQKDHLFNLWRTQENFTDIYEETNGIRNALEEQLDPCFNEFLRKGYFLEHDTIGSVSYKINYLAFELMKYVAGDDFCLMDKTTPEPNHKIIRHASFIVDPAWKSPSWLFKAKQLKSLLLWPRNSGEFAHLTRCDHNSSKQIHKKKGSLKFRLTSFNRDDGKLTSLNPPQTLERLNVYHWKGDKLPSQPIDNVSFFPSSLLAIQILKFSGCQHLPSFNTLPHLSSLELGGMRSLVDITVSWEDSETSSRKTFYPSLKRLVLCDMPELKGWSSTEAHDTQNVLEHYFFPLLTEVRVQCCPKLISMPSVPNLESLKAFNVDTRMLNHLMFPPVIDPLLNDVVNQELIETSKPNLTRFKYLEIDGCKEVVWGDKPNGIERGLWHYIKSVHSLKLTNIPELTSLSRDPECFLTIKQLSLCWLANLKVLPDLKGQFTQLRKLTIHYCPKLTMLPKSDGCFSALEQLEIRYCPRVSQFPESLPNLKRLQVQEFGRLEQILRVSQNLEELEINNCDELEWETPSVEVDASVNVWESLNRLHSLKLTKMDTFPKGLDFAKLSKLSRLVIEKCPKLTKHRHY